MTIAPGKMTGMLTGSPHDRPARLLFRLPLISGFARVTIVLLLMAAAATAQAPYIASPLSPASAVAGSGQLILTVNGTNFIPSSSPPGSVVQWTANSTTTPLTTTFVSPTHLTAVVPASLLTNPGVATVNVIQPNLEVSRGASFTVRPAGLGISKTHVGSFPLGDWATYQIIVSNSSPSTPTAGTVTVTDTPPASLSSFSMSGSGWTCSSGACSRSDVLAAGAQYPPIKVTGLLNFIGPASITNQAGVSGGRFGSAATADIAAVNLLTSNHLSSTPNPSVFGQPVTLVSSSLGPGTGTVTFYDGVDVLGAAPVVNGTATLATNLLPSGTRKLASYYSGDLNYASMKSNTVTQTVNAVAGSGFVTANTLAMGGRPVGYAVADFNGDGKTDFAATTDAGTSPACWP